MDRSVSFRLVTAAFGAVVLLSTAPAQTAPASPAAGSPILSSEGAAKDETTKRETAPASSRRSRAISPEVAAALAAAAPKFTGPAPKPPEPKKEEELPDQRDIDKPKNQIVRLKPYVVREPKPPIFTERSVSTEKGLKDIAMRRYISDLDRALNLASLPFFQGLAEKRAMAMYEEDERLRNMSDLENAALDASKTDAAAGTYIRREAQKTYLRSSDFGWNGGGPK